MAAIRRFWLVRDPTPDSTLDDILYEVDDVNDFASYCIGAGFQTFVREHHAMYLNEAEARRDAQKRLAIRGTAVKVATRFQAAVSPRQEAKRDVKPVNPPKGVDKSIVRENGKPDTSHLGEEEVAKPARRDIRPEDVFLAKPRDVSVRSLADTGKDMERAIKTQIPRDKGYDAVKNLSQYLIETHGGGGAKPVGVKS